MFQLNSSIVEVAAEEVVVSQSQLTRDKNKFQGQTLIICSRKSKNFRRSETSCWRTRLAMGLQTMKIRNSRIS